MYLPEYTITSEILRNISIIEYSKAVIEHTVILPSWEEKLKKDSQIKAVHNMLELEGISLSFEHVKKSVDGLEKKPSKEVKNVLDALKVAQETAKTNELGDETLKEFNALLLRELPGSEKAGAYRNTFVKNSANPSEILAKVIELVDWYHSLDARDTHPVILAGIIKARIEEIMPFSSYNKACADLTVQLSLTSKSYDFKSYLSLPTYYRNTLNEYYINFSAIQIHNGDLTDWLEYFTEGFANEASKVKDQVALLAKDTKVAKVSGRANLTDRQEQIVLHLQDYAVLKNKDFPKIFPDISEDTVLRDLKALIDEGIVVKKGKTKSSRYELA